MKLNFTCLFPKFKRYKYILSTVKIVYKQHHSVDVKEVFLLNTRKTSISFFLCVLTQYNDKSNFFSGHTPTLVLRNFSFGNSDIGANYYAADRGE